MGNPYKQKNRKTATLLEVVEKYYNGPIKKILVVGCGNGQEAGFITRHFKAQTIGIDIGQELLFDRKLSCPATVAIMDARYMAFPYSSFDFIYSFHALEHIENPGIALKEMARVLKPTGLCVIGTPNKSRLMGYVCSATSLKNKWNYNDWNARIKGKWANEHGAHAGFTESKLVAMCRTAFENQ